MTDLSTRALFEGRRLLVPEGKGYAQSKRAIHEPGSFERQWAREVEGGVTCLTFEEWMRRKGWR